MPPKGGSGTPPPLQVSWVRRRDWHILTSGTQTYTREERFAVHHPEGSTEWTLAIKYVQLSDAGTYECQVSATTIYAYESRVNAFTGLRVPNQTTEEPISRASCCNPSLQHDRQTAACHHRLV